jgi:hypothetical protein
MTPATGQIIIALAAFVLFLAVVFVLRSRQGISRHPYQDPYGDTPGAWRSQSPSRNVEEAIRSVPGTR